MSGSNSELFTSKEVPKHKNSHNENEKKLLSGNDKSKESDSISIKSKGHKRELERIKSDPGFKKAKTIDKKSVDTPSETSESKSSSISNEKLAERLNKQVQEVQQADEDDKTDGGEAQKIKAGIVLDKDGYYHGNILSEKIEDIDGTTTKQRIMKVRLMPVECKSANEDDCSVKEAKGTVREQAHEEDEDRYDYSRNKKLKEERFLKREPIETMHLMASFNYWDPIELKMDKPPEIEGEGEDNNNSEEITFTFCDYLPSGKHYFYFIKNKKYFTLCKKYKIGKFKDCKNVWLNYIEVDKEFSKVELLYEKQKKKQVEKQDDIRDFYLYRNWKADDDFLLKKMFEVDWVYTKIFRFIKGNEKELNLVKKVLWRNYSKIKELFTSESGLSSYPSISWNDFTAFCYYCQLVDKNLNLSSLDMIFIATNVSLHEYAGNAERSLSRYEFLEILVRLAIAKYGNTMVPHKALEALLENHIFKYCNPSEIADFRRTHVLTSLVDKYIKRNEPMLSKLYNKFIHGVKNYFTCKDALELCSKLKLKISERSVTYSYSCAKISVIDPVKEPLLAQKMGFAEFLICLCGIANEYFKDDAVLSKELTLDQKLHRILQNESRV